MKHALSLSLSSICAKPLTSALSIFAVACAVCLLCGLFLFINGVEKGFAKNSQNIDMVVGAKGSPLQLVLSSVYHIDIPNGNIDMEQAEKIIKNPNVKKAIPLAVGDNYRGFRVVGTTSDYLDLYDLKLSSGQVFQKPFEVVAGASTGLNMGDTFAASHGFSVDGGDVHDEFLYKVVGVLAQSGTVADKLLLTPYQSVQNAHDHEGHDHDKEKDMGDITALLLQVKTPMAVMMLPREINKHENILAASPSYEMAKLLKNFGLGERFVYIMSFALMGLSVLMVFSNLSSNLVTRQYDLAVLRVLGASPTTVFSTVLCEGALIGSVGALIGVVMGHITTYFIVLNMPSLQSMMIPLDMLKFQIQDLYFILLGVLSGCFAALIPARNASKIDIAALLAKGSS